MKKLLWFFGLLLFLTSQGCVSLPVSPPETKPMITHAFISKEKGRYRDVLRIYIEADDPKGFMLKVATAVDQVGYGHYPTDWIYLKSEYQHHLTGYLQWNTFSYSTSWMPEGTRITIRISIFDTSGNESNEVVFPFEFVSQIFPEAPLPAPFNQGDIPRLGYIHINLFNPFQREEERERFQRRPFE